MWAIANFCCSKTLLFLHPGRVTGWACFLPHQRDYHGHVYNHSFSRSPSVSLLQSYFTYPRHPCNSFIFNPSFVFQGYLKCGSSDFQKYLATSPSKHQKSSSVKQCKTKHLLLFIQTSSMTTYKQKKKNPTTPNHPPKPKPKNKDFPCVVHDLHFASRIHRSPGQDRRALVSGVEPGLQPPQTLHWIKTQKMKYSRLNTCLSHLENCPLA